MSYGGYSSGGNASRSGTSSKSGAWSKWSGSSGGNWSSSGADHSWSSSSADQSSGRQLAKIQALVEFYLSDQNLATDFFFGDKIRENPEGWVDMDRILEGRKMKKLNATKESVFEALKDSKLELKGVDGGHAAVRRPPHWVLPDLPSYVPDETGAEKRLDLFDRKPYSFEEVKENYAHMKYSDAELLDYWENQMRKIQRVLANEPSGATPLKSAPADGNDVKVGARCKVLASCEAGEEGYMGLQVDDVVEISYVGQTASRDAEWLYGSKVASGEQGWMPLSSFRTAASESQRCEIQVGSKCKTLSSCTSSEESYLSLTVNELVEVLYVGQEKSGDADWLYGTQLATGEKGWLPLSVFR